MNECTMEYTIESSDSQTFVTILNELGEEKLTEQLQAGDVTERFKLASGYQIKINRKIIIVE